MDTLLLSKAFVLGIVEGLTEFLPISSTGHLIVVGSLLDYTDARSDVFKIVIQFGAILAVCWIYRERIRAIIFGLPSDPVQQRFTGYLLLAFLPAMLLGALFHDSIKSVLFNPVSVATALIAGGVAILYIERNPRTPRYTEIDDINWRTALKIGLAQTLALIPGVSRAGATIMGGLVFGLSRSAATEFSFFLAIPTMLAATSFDLYTNWNLLSAGDLPVFSVGFVAAFVTAVMTVRTLLAFVSRHSFRGFAWYRIAFGVAVLIGMPAF